MCCGWHRPIQLKKQGDRILFGYGGDRLCKGYSISRVIAPQKKTFAIAIFSGRKAR
jgi:hypothetical protein